MKGNSCSPIVLCGSRLTVEIAYPEAGLHGTRFDRSARITQVRLNSGAGSPTHTFCVPESFIPGHGTGGEGLCSEFDIETPGGYAETRPGDLFAKFGVGLLVRPDDAPYSCTRPYAVARFFPVHTAVTESQATFTTEPLECGGIAARVVRTVSVRENELSLATTLENVGQKTILTRDYCHNFVGFDNHPLGPEYVLRLPGRPVPLPARGAEEELAREDLILNAAEVRLRQTPKHPFYCRFTGVCQSSDAQWLLRHESSGLAMSESDDFAPVAVNLWGESHVISPEIFVEMVARPGETRHWSRCYRFDH